MEEPREPAVINQAPASTVRPGFGHAGAGFQGVSPMKGLIIADGNQLFNHVSE